MDMHCCGCCNIGHYPKCKKDIKELLDENIEFEEECDKLKKKLFNKSAQILEQKSQIKLLINALNDFLAIPLFNKCDDECGYNICLTCNAKYVLKEVERRKW